MSVRMSTQSYLKGYGNINIEAINNNYEKSKKRGTKRKSYIKKKTTYQSKQMKSELKRVEIQRLKDQYVKMRFDYKLDNNLTVNDFKVYHPLPGCVNDLLTLFNTRNEDPFNIISFELLDKKMLNIIVCIPNKKEKIIVHYDTLYMKPVLFTIKNIITKEKHSYKIDKPEKLISRIEMYMIKSASKLFVNR